jgi:membrane-associated protease RseP (regulator of RpoE activity)
VRAEEYLASADVAEAATTVSKKRPTLTPARVAIHVLLLLITLASTYLAVLFFYPPISLSQTLTDPEFIANGLAYSLTLITILLAHEMGHYLACRYYGVDATLPYFLPAILPFQPYLTMIGTFGAFIRIREPIRSRRALFDIGIAGPLAGFAFALPAAFIGLWIAEPAPPIPPGAGGMVFEDPLLFIAFTRLFDRPHVWEWNPVYFAAWVGILATSLNLLPVGQLDGGHVVYALLGRRGHRVIAFTMFAFICVLAIASYSRHQSPVWFFYVFILGLMLGLKHPPVADEDQPLDRTRVMIALVGLLVFILCFIPFPITFS